MDIITILSEFGYDFSSAPPKPTDLHLTYDISDVADPLTDPIKAIKAKILFDKQNRSNPSLFNFESWKDGYEYYFWCALNTACDLATPSSIGVGEELLNKLTSTTSLQNVELSAKKSVASFLDKIKIERNRKFRIERGYKALIPKLQNSINHKQILDDHDNILLNLADHLILPSNDLIEVLGNNHEINAKFVASLHACIFLKQLSIDYEEFKNNIHPSCFLNQDNITINTQNRKSLLISLKETSAQISKIFEAHIQAFIADQNLQDKARSLLPNYADWIGIDALLTPITEEAGRNALDPNYLYKTDPKKIEVKTKTETKKIDTASLKLYFSKESLLQSFIKGCTQSGQYCLISVDNLSSFTSDEFEMSKEECYRLLSMLRQYTLKSNTTLLCLHHSVKINDENDQFKGRGTAAIDFTFSTILSILPKFNTQKLEMLRDDLNEFFPGMVNELQLTCFKNTQYDHGDYYTPYSQSILLYKRQIYPHISGYYLSTPTDTQREELHTLLMANKLDINARDLSQLQRIIKFERDTFQLNDNFQ